MKGAHHWQNEGWAFVQGRAEASRETGFSILLSKRKAYISVISSGYSVAEISFALFALKAVPGKVSEMVKKRFPLEAYSFTVTEVPVHKITCKLIWKGRNLLHLKWWKSNDARSNQKTFCHQWKFCFSGTRPCFLFKNSFFFFLFWFYIYFCFPCTTGHTAFQMQNGSAVPLFAEASINI